MSGRRRWTFLAVVIAFVIVGLTIGPSLIHRQILGLGATDIHDVVSLPDRINVCGRSWSKDALGRTFTHAQVQAQFGSAPSLVHPLPLPPCPVGPCTRAAQNGPCDTVVFVRVGDDAYLAYALQGGP